MILRKYLENGANGEKNGAGGRGLVISLLRNLLDLRYVICLVYKRWIVL